MSDYREKVAPVLFLGAFGLAVAGNLFGWHHGLIVKALTFGIWIGFILIFGIVASLAAASLLNLSYGYLGPAVLKLAAVIAVAAVVSAFVPFMPVKLFFFWMITYVLEMWLFEFESRDAMISAGILLLVYVAASLLLAFASVS